MNKKQKKRNIILSTCVLCTANVAVGYGGFGSFAETGDGAMSFTDTVAATVISSCGMYDKYSSSSNNTATTVEKSYSRTIALGEVVEWDLATEEIVVCNDANGWRITAVGIGEGSSVDKMAASTGEDDDLGTGTDFSGAKGMWAMKVVKGNDASNELTSDNGFGEYRTIPTTPITVVSSDGTTDQKSGVFMTGYKVYIGTETPAGTYTGKVLYTLVHPAASGGDTKSTKGGDDAKKGEDKVENENIDNQVKEETKKEEDVEENQGQVIEEGGGSKNVEEVREEVKEEVEQAGGYQNLGGANRFGTLSFTPMENSENGEKKVMKNTTTETNKTADDGEVKPLGVMSKTTNESKAGDNTALIVALAATGVAAAAAGGIYLYGKSEE